MPCLFSPVALDDLRQDPTFKVKTVNEIIGTAIVIPGLRQFFFIFRFTGSPLFLPGKTLVVLIPL